MKKNNCRKHYIFFDPIMGLIVVFMLFGGLLSFSLITGQFDQNTLLLLVGYLIIIGEILHLYKNTFKCYDKNIIVQTTLISTLIGFIIMTIGVEKFYNKTNITPGSFWLFNLITISLISPILKRIITSQSK